MVKPLLGVGGGVPKSVGIVEIKGYKGKYWAGTDGHIYAFTTAHRFLKKPKPLRLSESTGSCGYYFVAIILNGKKRSINVHTLICEAFNGPKPGSKMCVRHLDGNSKNNLPDNLKWGTYKENEEDKLRHGRRARGEKQGSAKLTEKTIRLIRTNVDRGIWNSVTASEELGVDSSTIRRIVARKDWKHVI